MQLILCGLKCRAFQSRRKHQIKTNDSAFSHRWQMVSLRLAFDIRPIWHSHPSSSLSPHTHTDRYALFQIKRHCPYHSNHSYLLLFHFVRASVCGYVATGLRTQNGSNVNIKRTHIQHKQKRNRFRAVKNNDAPCLLLCSALLYRTNWTYFLTRKRRLFSLPNATHCVAPA